MNGILLDTNAVIAIVNRKPPGPAARMLVHPRAMICTSTIVVHELYLGAFRSERIQSNLDRLQTALSDFTILPLEEADAREAGEIRAALYAKGTPIGPYDTLIAGQARARRLTLVTNNIREFQRVNGLAIEDWSA